MSKYVISALAVISMLAAFLIYVGGDATLVIRSNALRPPFNFGEIEIKWQAALVLFLLSVVFLLALWSLLTWLLSLPRRLRQGAGLKRRDKAFVAIEDALIAGAEGNQSAARSKSEHVRKLVGASALGRMVSAQAAVASGDSEEAVTHFKAMLDDPRTAATAQRGLASHLFTTGDLSGAIAHAGAAYASDNDNAWAFDILFKAQVADHRWADALETLLRGESRKHIDSKVAKRRAAVLMTAEAQRLDLAGQEVLAREMITEAATTYPAFAPGVALATKLLRLNNNTRKAFGLIEKAWAKSPHPALVVAFRDMNQFESEKTQKKRVTSLMRANPEHRESLIVQIEEALRDDDAVKALSLLDPLLQSENPSTRICLLAAQAERALGNIQDASLWTERAAFAPVEADWTDLDPEGEAFNYTDQDWRRLIFTYGETGQLIHPRFEAGAPRRRLEVMGSKANAPVSATAAAGVATALTEPQIPSEEIAEASDVIDEIVADGLEIDTIEDTLSVDILTPEDTDDLASRLDGLLDDVAPDDDRK